MSTTQVVLTPEQQQTVNAMLKKFADRLLPAKLKNTNRNGLLLADYNVSRGLPINENTLYDAAKEIYQELEWDIKPNRLLADERNAAQFAVPVKTESLVKLEQQRAKTLKDAEIADAFAKQQEEFEMASLELIDAFLPLTKYGRVDNRKRDDVQTLLKSHVAKEKARGCRMQDVHKIVAAEIQRQYTLIEKASERL